MTRRYTPKEKSNALDQLASCDGDITEASKRTGIPAQTLRRWVEAQRKHRRERQWAKMERAYDKLAENAMKLTQAISEQIDDAPLNQLATTLNAVVNQFLKLDEQIAQMQTESESEQVYRVEYKYPDGSLHARPHWARNDPEYTSPFQGGRVREALREDGDRQTGHYPNGLHGGEMLVAGPNLPDGQSGVAGFEDDPAGLAAVD